jgi:hypothetical protein
MSAKPTVASDAFSPRGRYPFRSCSSKAWQVSVLPTTFLLDGNLVPRFVAEGDVDWTRPEIEESVMNLVRQKTAGRAGRAF